MANTITTQTLNNGPRNLTIKVTIEGDGTGEEASTQLVDISSFDADEARINSVTGSLNGFAVHLEWDATANVQAWTLPEGESFADFRPIGGIQNDAGAGKTGDIDFSTTGLGDGDKGSFLLELVKK